jgi:hypothetical protein
VKAIGHPDYTYVLVYPGGHGGEFLSFWLGHHEKCILTPTSLLENNRYVTKFDQVKIHPRANTLKLFLPGHDQTTHRAKNGFFATDSSRVIGTSVSTVYQKFYFLLFALKTICFKYSNTQAIEHTSSKQHLAFLSAIHPRTEFYYDEFAAWQSNHQVPSINQIIKRRFDQACIKDPGIKRFSVQGVDFCINLDCLFFGNTTDQAVEYQRVCDHIGLVPDLKLLDQLNQYHTRNLELAAAAINMSIPEFIALSNDKAQSVILSAFGINKIQPT